MRGYLMWKQRLTNLTFAVVLMLSVLSVVPASVWAATDTCSWTGAANANWSNGGNWTGCDNGGVPENGDALAFPEVATNKSMSNDIAGLSVTGLSFSGTGYTVSGNALTITTVNALDATASVTINTNITYTGFNISITPDSGTVITINGTTNFSSAGGEVNIGGSGRDGTVEFYGNITGSAATQFVAVSGATAVVRGAANTYTACTVGAESNARFTCRSLTCFGNVANDMYSGGGVIDIYTAGSYANDIVTSSVNPNTSAIWAYANVTLDGAATVNDSLFFGQGVNGNTLTVNGNVSLVSEALQISGASRLANIVINGDISGTQGVFAYVSHLTLSGANTYSGMTYATSGAATITVTHPTGLGSNAAGTSLGDGDSLEFDFASAQTVSEPLDVIGSGVSSTGAVVQAGESTTLSGNIVLSGDTTFGVDTGAAFSAFTLSGVISGTGNVTVTTSPSTVFANSSIQFTGASANTYTGKLTVQGVRFYPSKADTVTAVTGDMDVLATATKPSTVETSFDESIANTSHVHLMKSGSNDASLYIGTGALETIGYVTGDGELSVGANGAAVVLSSNTSYTFAGNVSKFSNFPAGDSYVVKKGSGTATFTGGVDTSYVGGEAPVFGAQEGSLLLNGNFTEAGTIVLSGATLKGTGTVGDVDVDSGGTVAIGNSPGCMTFGSLLLNAGSTWQQEITGSTACSQYDKATVSGAVNLGGATLQVSQLAGFNPAQNLVFTIIDGTSLTGTFAGLANGAVFAVNGVNYRINYFASGEVTLTVVTTAANATTATTTLASTGSPAGLLTALSLGIITLAATTFAVRRRAFAFIHRQK
ncbi:hypothetical protein IPL68_06235 [Candidatus Saccharibacteria bacterium]|nr:MAG: hypothetical protein IPL68_06235 [Candidatus Saccharibacteria bacterium]